MSWSNIQNSINNTVMRAFSVDALYDGVRRVSVIFKKEYYESITGEAGHASSTPVATVMDSENLEKGKTLLIKNITYNIIGVEKQGAGLTRLTLRTE